MITGAHFILYVDDPAAYHERASRHGARELNPLAPRNWGDAAAYSLDPDGLIPAFARRQARAGAGS